MSIEKIKTSLLAMFIVLPKSSYLIWYTRRVVEFHTHYCYFETENSIQFVSNFKKQMRGNWVISETLRNH